MDIKRSTTAFVKAESPREKSDGLNNLSAMDQAKIIGDGNVGDLLNKVTDPNFVAQKTTRGVGGSEMNKDAFFKMMLAQMKNQDPTNTLKSHEMAAQLAQFTSLEQLTNLNAGVKELKDQNAPSVNYQALALIGKQVSGDTSKISRSVGDTKHDIAFKLAADATSAQVSIKDNIGNIIRKIELKTLKKGDNIATWNGLSDDARAIGAGEYKISIEARGADGRKVFAKTEFSGKISGLNFTPQGPVIMMGDSQIRMADIKKIEDMPLEQPQAIGSAIQPAIQKLGDDVKNLQPAPDNDIINNMENTPMASALKNQISQAGQ